MVTIHFYFKRTFLPTPLIIARRGEGVRYNTKLNRGHKKEKQNVMLLLTPPLFVFIVIFVYTFPTIWISIKE